MSINASGDVLVSRDASFVKMSHIIIVEPRVTVRLAAEELREVVDY